MIEYPTHRVLLDSSQNCVEAVMDCFGGKVLLVTRRRYSVGAVIETGPIATDMSGGTNAVDRKFWLVVGHANWMEAESMAEKAGCTKPPQVGVWHEVISE